MPEKEKILKDIDAFIDLWKEEVKRAEIVRNKAQVQLINSLNYFMETEKAEDGRAFDLCVLLFDKALEILQSDRDTLRQAGYYADCIRGSVRALAGIEDEKPAEEAEEETLERMATTISLSADTEKAFLRLLDICKESIIERNRKSTEIIIRFE